MKNNNKKLNEVKQLFESNDSFNHEDTNSSWIDATTYSSLEAVGEDKELANEMIENEIDCFNNKELNSNWVNSNIYSSQTIEIDEELVVEQIEKETQVITKKTFFDQIKNSTINILNKCRKDNRSLITGFLVVASLSCFITLSVINISYKNLNVSSQNFEVDEQTSPSKSFNRNQNSHQNNNQFEPYSNDESFNELTDEQREAIIKYYFQYQKGASNQNQPF